MRKILFLALLALGFAACSSGEENEPPPVKENVDFTVDYKFWESGSMSRSGQTLYQSFYDNYIKEKVLTPTTYSLTFTNQETQAKVSFDGKWGEKNIMKLLEGKYEVTGYAKPKYNDKYGLDTISIVFNETVDIQKTTEKINLTAKHDSYMLMFDAASIESIQYRISSSLYRYDLTKLDEIYYMFIRELYDSSPYNSLTITRKNGKTSTIKLDQIPFEKGKYYYFNDITESFDLPPMEAGN